MWLEKGFSSLFSVWYSSECPLLGPEALGVGRENRENIEEWHLNGHACGQNRKKKIQYTWAEQAAAKMWYSD